MGLVRWKETHVVDLVKGNISSVLDVLLLLSVPWGFWILVLVLEGMCGWSGVSILFPLNIPAPPTFRKTFSLHQTIPLKNRLTLQCLDDQGRGGWDDGDSCLSVLDGELDSDS